MKKAIYNLICAVGLAGGLASCSDFLEIEPQDKILEDNFWSEKTDVMSAVAGCYDALQSEQVIRRMMIWGEFRSDNVTSGSGLSDDRNLENIFLENIKATNGYTTWVDFYNVINRCNIVIKKAPGVAAIDPSYTQSELKATLAEVSALRDLCYFYLIRAFRNVPYTTEAYTDDDQQMALPASSFDAVLDSLIVDLERVQDDALRKYSEIQPLYQTGRITQDAIHAMLCEMYLWKQDYANCIRYADMVIDAKKADAEEEKNKNGSSGSQSANDIYNGFPLISGSSSNSMIAYYGNAYNDIFGEGNSKEGIFEITYMKDDDAMPSNVAVSAFYGNGTKSRMGMAAVPTFIGQDISASTFSVYNNKYDSRAYENVFEMGQLYSINKLVSREVQVGASITTSGQFVGTSLSVYAENKHKSNWIVYRLTDIMLLKAEALVQQMASLDTTGANEQLRQEAFLLVNAVNKRSLCQPRTALKDTLLYSDYATKNQLEELVLLERQRELMFEGKRWFDLVRTSRRDGNTNTLINRTLQKYSSNTSVISSKLTRMDAIYWPYNSDELKVNPNLTQNPAYGTGEEGSYERVE